MGAWFQECIAVDITFYKGKIVLHLIDHTARLLPSNFNRSNDPKVIIRANFKSWVHQYGAQGKLFEE